MGLLPHLLEGAEPSVQVHNIAAAAPRICIAELRPHGRCHIGVHDGGGLHAGVLQQLRHECCEQEAADGEYNAKYDDNASCKWQKRMAWFNGPCRMLATNIFMKTLVHEPAARNAERAAFHALWLMSGHTSMLGTKNDGRIEGCRGKETLITEGLEISCTGTPLLGGLGSKARRGIAIVNHMAKDGPSLAVALSIVSTRSSNTLHRARGQC